MQTGMKAGLAIVLAVFLTGIVGFLTAVTPEDEERIYYNQVSDLTPIIDYTAIDSYTEYNPITNVSGWADNEGVSIPFLTNGISAYPYRHYVESEDVTNYYTVTYTPAILDQNWSSIEDASWYPIADAHEFPFNVGSSATHGGVTIERVARGHISVETDYTDPDTSSFSIYFAHYDGDNNLVHGFTCTYEEWTTGSTNESLSITSLSQFDSAPSIFTRMVPPASNMGLVVDIDVDITLPEGHYLSGSIITSQDSTTTGHYGYWLNLWNGELTGGQQFDPVNDYDVYNGGMNWKSRSNGSSTTYVSIINEITINGVRVDTELDAYTVVPFSQIVGDRAITDRSTMYVNYPIYYGTTSYSMSNPYTAAIEGVYTANLTSISEGKVTYVADDQRWYPSVLSDNGLYYEPDITKPGYPSDETFVVVKGWLPYFYAHSTYPVYEYKYVDANKFVEIGNGVTGKWKNYMDSTTGGQTVTSPYNNGQIILLTEPGTVISSDNVFWKDDGGNVTRGTMQLTVPTSVPYSMALVTLDFQGGQFYAQGVVWGAIDVSDRNTSNWTLRPHQYPITPSFSEGGSPSYVQGLSFTKTGGTKVFIVSTNVQTDPMGRLWGDPSVYLGYYFPDYFQYDATTGNTGVPTTAIRVLFNGFVSYGTSFTINGQTMPISDGEISFTYYTYETAYDTSTNPPTEYTETITNTATKPIKGMAVDWEDGHVYLVFTEQGKTRYDLGEYDPTSVNVIIADADTGKDTVATDVISGTGTWYWQANLYTIHHEMETVLHLDLSKGLGGWGMSLQVSMLLFVAMLIVGVAIVHYYYRESDEPMGILDWIIIGLAILLSLGVAML